ncbi:MAG: hypothetical protein WC477_01565 [Patescibacteria group bacterium]
MFLPIWALIAIAGHIANGAAFVIDKSLLSTSFKRAATYAGTVGILGVFASVLFFFGAGLPHGIGWLYSTIAGASFILALWMFFQALGQGEASRIVPIVGSLIPILTFAGTFLFMGEVLTSSQTIGFALLIIATIILAGGSSSHRLTSRAIVSACIAAFLFAVASVSIKLGYDTDGFMTTFTTSRIIGAIMAVLLVFMDPKATRELFRAVFPKPSSKKSAKNGALWLVMIGQTLGAGGFVLVQYAMSMGSASIVNALQAVQYAFLVLVAFALAKRAPKLLGEDLTPKTITRKLIAILLTAIGLWLAV